MFRAVKYETEGTRMWDCECQWCWSEKKHQEIKKKRLLCCSSHYTKISAIMDCDSLLWTKTVVTKFRDNVLGCNHVEAITSHFGQLLKPWT